MSAEPSAKAKNLAAIQKAIVKHNGNCDFPILEIRLNPFEYERLGWQDFRGIPVKPDERLSTGIFRLICEGQHDDSPATSTETESGWVEHAKVAPDGVEIEARGPRGIPPLRPRPVGLASSAPPCNCPKVCEGQVGKACAQRGGVFR